MLSAAKVAILKWGKCVMKVSLQNLVRGSVVLTMGLVLFLMPTPGAAQVKPHPGPFEKGRVRVGFYGGASSSADRTYFILGGGFGYYLADGLEVGSDFEGWFFEDPTIWKLTPQVRYVMWQMEPVRPYGGAFWRQTFVGEPFEDYSSYGGRAGLAYRNGGNYLSAGFVYERFSDCVSGDCDDLYPEFGFWLSF